jgi:hypothetical protein
MLSVSMLTISSYRTKLLFINVVTKHLYLNPLNLFIVFYSLFTFHFIKLIAIDLIKLSYLLYSVFHD